MSIASPRVLHGLLALVLLASASVRAADPPHDETSGMDCDSCHAVLDSPLADIATADGNVSICLSCHSVGSMTMNEALHKEAGADVGSSGTSHSFASSALVFLRVDKLAGTTAVVAASGIYTGTERRVYTCEITTGGGVATAVMDWTDDLAGTDSVPLAPSLSLPDGLVLSFNDAGGTTSFSQGMVFRVIAEPIPASPPPELTDHLFNGGIACSTCHDQHANTTPPFLRLPAEDGTLCEACHGNRHLGSWKDDPAVNVGHHPIGVEVPQEYPYKADNPAIPLWDPDTPADPADDTVECLSCHAMHHADSNTDGDPDLLGEGDGRLLRLAMGNELCKACHEITDHVGRECLSCHTPHETSNILLLKEYIDDRPVSLTSIAPDDLIKGDPGYDGVCETCHTATAVHTNSPAGDHDHFVDKSCTDCHKHANGFAIVSNDCLSCHDVEQNTSPDDTARRSVGADFKNPGGHHPFTYTQDGDHSDPQQNNCIICHLETDYYNANHADEVVDLNQDPDNSGDTEWQTTPGLLHAWCVDCHDGDNPDPQYRLNGTVASDKSFMAVESTHTEAWPASGAVFAGLCNSCHQNGHTARVQFFSYFYNEGHEEDACYGCHGGAANVSTNDGTGARYMENMKVAYPGTGAVSPKSRHAGLGETGDGRVLCRECHDPHRLNHQENLLCNPDDRQQSWGGDVSNAWCLACHDDTQAATPVHLDFDVTGLECAQCHLPHSSTNGTLLLIEELDTLTVDVSPDTVSVPLTDFQQFDADLTPELFYLTRDGRRKQADWGIQGLTGGSAGWSQQVDANIPLDRSVGYIASGWGLIDVESTVEVTGGPSIVEDLNVYMDVPHHYRGDIELWLRNLTTGVEVQFAQSNWSEGTWNLMQTYDSESPYPTGTAATPGDGNTGTGVVRTNIHRDGYTGPQGGITYTITITQDGDSGAALFDWSDTNGGSGTGVVTTHLGVDLGNGIEARFYNAWGGSSPQFRAGSTWTYDPLLHWNTAPDSFTAFNDRNSNGTWQLELHDTWPSDNPTDTANPGFCELRGWKLVFNSGVLGTLTDTGVFQAQYEGAGRIFATFHHGRIHPIQSGLSDLVFEDPLPISNYAEVGVGPAATKAAGNPPNPGVTVLDLERAAAVADQRIRQAAAKSVASKGLDETGPHAREVLADMSCRECHAQ